MSSLCLSGGAKSPRVDAATKRRPSRWDQAGDWPSVLPTDRNGYACRQGNHCFSLALLTITN